MYGTMAFGQCRPNQFHFYNQRLAAASGQSSSCWVTYFDQLGNGHGAWVVGFEPQKPIIRSSAAMYEGCGAFYTPPTFFLWLKATAHGKEGLGLREMKGWAYGEIGELIEIIDLAWADIRLLIR